MPAIVANLDDLNYKSTNNGQGYYFEIAVVMGEGYIVTEKAIEYLIIPQDDQIEAFAKGRDSARKADASELLNGIERFYVSRMCYPWSWSSADKRCFSPPAKKPTPTVLDFNGSEKPLIDENELKPTKDVLESWSKSKFWIVEDLRLDAPGNAFICFEPESKTMRGGNLGSLRGDLKHPTNSPIANCSSNEYHGNQDPNQNCWMCLPQ